MKKKVAAFLMACVLCHNALHADELEYAGALSSYTGDELVVTATRFPVKEKESSRFITVADSEKLKETGATNVMEALGRIGGLGYKSLAPMGINFKGMNAAVYIRGIEDGELVLINGMPIQQGSSKGYDLSTIPLDQIERIEVLKGAASTLYGADAMSGVINIITKKPADTKGATASIEFGNEEWMNHGVSISLPGITAGVRYQHLGAIDDAGRTYNSSPTKAYTKALGETDKVMVNVNASPFSNTYIDYQYNWYETTFINLYDSGKEKQSDQETDFHFINLRYESDRFKAKAFGVYDNRYQTDYVDGEFDCRNQRLNYNYGAETDYRFVLSDWVELIAGADYVHRGSDYEGRYEKKDRDDYGFFGELKTELADGAVIVTLGAREQFIDNMEERPDYDEFLPTAGVTFKVNDRLNLFANTGKAFQAPTFFMLYNDSDSFVSNPDLTPEYGWTYETGLKWDAENASVRLAGFYMAYDDKIETYKVSTPEGDKTSYFNSGSYSSRGVEWNLGLYPFISMDSFLADVSFSAAGYLADPVAEDVDGIDYQPSPKFQNTFGISYRTIPVALDFKCRMLAERQKELDSYTAFDMTGKVKAGNGHVILTVENLFDTEIQSTGDLVDYPDGGYVYREPGRLVRLGYSVSF